MSEGTDSSTHDRELEQPTAASAPTDKGKKKLWLMIAAVAVAALLIGAVLLIVVIPGKELTAKISPDTVAIEAGAAKALSVKITWNDHVLAAKESGLVYLWSVEPSTMGSFNLRAVANVTFTAANVGGDGKIMCKVTYKGKTVTPEVDLSINPPVLDSVFVSPSTKTLGLNQGFVFNATALSSVGTPITVGVIFTWSVTNMTQYTLNTTTGPSVNFTGLENGTAVLTAQTTYRDVTKNGSANVTVGTLPVRSVDYRYYDFFELPFGQWWDLRWDFYKEEQIISRSYPTMFYWYSQPMGNIWIYTNMMLDVKGKNMSEINMNSHPQFLPLLGSTSGGNAKIDWFMQYITKEEMARYPGATAAWLDGWVISLNGTTTMDKQAAMAVLGVTSAGFDDFANWWTANERNVEDAYTAWLLNEGNKRLDIYNMYEYPLVPLTFELTAQKVVDKIVLSYDLISWGMEALMTRWLHEAFTPTEAFFEGFNLHAEIGPERADVEINTEIAYGVYAYETTIIPTGKTHGDPAWVFELYPQDYVAPSIKHPKSDFTPYVYSEDPLSHQHNFTYDNTAPGSLWYGQKMPYDYAPGPHNLSANETLVIEFPTGPVIFKEQAYYPNGTPILDQGANLSNPNSYLRIWNSTANMTYAYSEPMPSDNPELGPGTPIVVDNVAGRLTFTGPIDMWNWSKTQTKHPFLEGEWDRLRIIPYGIPYVEFTWAQKPPDPKADHYAVSAMSSPVIAGEPVSFAVTVVDQYGNTYSNYNGTLNFTSSDAAAVLPGNYTFNTTDAGIHVFNNLTFGTAGLQDLHLFDATNASLTGNKTAISVLAAAAADHFTLSGIPSSVGINAPQNLTVTVYDQYGRLFVGYTGTIAFDSNRSGEVVLPSDTTVPIGQSNVTILGGVTFTAVGSFQVNASDGPIRGQIVVQVELEPPRLDHFAVTGATVLAPRMYYDLTVEAVSQFGNTFDTYNTIVNFTTDAPAGTYSLPANTQFLLADHGMKVFTNAMWFSQMGTYWVNVSDTVTTAAYGLLTGISVAARPNIVYTAYDFFQEPWGEWYTNKKFRWDYYGRDYILSNTTGKYVQLYDTSKAGDGSQALIYAPYRYNMTATNVTNVDVHHPEFMPVNDTVGPVAGAEASMSIRMQYLDLAWWWSYWMQQFGKGNPFLGSYYNTSNDGYLLGVVYNIELNREAAYEWMNMSMSETDPMAWWTANKGTYESWWDAWVVNEGNVRQDIFCGYEDRYYSEKLWMNMTVDTDGDILLRISHVSWGYEVLLVRWLDEVQLSTHQPWFEDFDMDVTYGNGIANVSFDGAVQYGFHAVKANASATNEGAWVFENVRIDYWPSWSQAPAIHPSDYDPYAGPSWSPLGPPNTFQSWAAGDPKFGKTTVEYDTTPNKLVLNEYQTLVVKLPLGTVPGYLGQGVGPLAIFNMSTGDTGDYDALRYNGTASLGFVITNSTNPLDIPSLYDSVNKTLTIKGPFDFNNADGRTGGVLYHGAPWIEFDISPTLKTESVVEATPEVGAQSAPAVTAEMLSLVAVISGVVIAVPALIGTRRWDE